MNLMKKVAVSLVAIVVIAAVKLALNPPATTLACENDWETAVAKAKAEQKPILLVFGGPW